MTCIYVAERYAELQYLLSGWGYAIDPGGGRDGPSRWDDLARVEPVTGLVRIRALHGFESQFANDVYVEFTEFWIPQQATGPLQVRGNTLVSYAYHCQAGADQAGELRYDYDPERHPDMPSHKHAAGKRRPCAYLTAEGVIEDFEKLIYRRLAAGFMPTLADLPVQRT
jgi:hypothetical protein